MKIIVADDSVLFREGLSALLTQFGHEVIEQTPDAPSLSKRVSSRQEPAPDLVITDIRMPPHRGNDGLNAALRIREQQPHIPIIVLSQYVADAYALQWITASGKQQRPAGVGYLLKERIGEVSDFMHAVHAVAAGGVVIDPEVVQSILKPGKSNRLQLLTPREEEVLSHMARGLTNAEIASEMYLSAAGVAKHISGIFTSLNLDQETGNRRVLAVLEYVAQSDAQDER